MIKISNKLEHFSVHSQTPYCPVFSTHLASIVLVPLVVANPWLQRSFCAGASSLRSSSAGGGSVFGQALCVSVPQKFGFSTESKNLDLLSPHNYKMSGGGTQERSPPPTRNRKNCCRNLVGIFQRYILSERRLNSKKYLVENCGKKCQFSIEILIKKSQIFLKNFKIFYIVSSKRARFCRHLAKFNLPSGNHSSNHDDLQFFYKFLSIFSKNLKNFHAIFNSPLSKLFLSFFHKFIR